MSRFDFGGEAESKTRKATAATTATAAVSTEQKAKKTYKSLETARRGLTGRAEIPAAVHVSEVTRETKDNSVRSLQLLCPKVAQ
jgi:hypothetical protein